MLLFYCHKCGIRFVALRELFIRCPECKQECVAKGPYLWESGIADHLDVDAKPLLVLTLDEAKKWEIARQCFWTFCDGKMVKTSANSGVCTVCNGAYKIVENV